MNKKVIIIDYGAGNIQSLKFALKRLDIRAETSTDAKTIQSADKVIFPGVGHAESAMLKLKESGLDVIIPKLTQPVLGICLGMQLMCQSTEEGNVKGLGVFDVDIKRFDTQLKVPHMGWNIIRDLKGDLFEAFPKEAYMYFVHSFYAPTNQNSIARTNYGLNFCAALQNKNFFGVQFHPEKSSELGEKILINFMQTQKS